MANAQKTPDSHLKSVFLLQFIGSVVLLMVVFTGLGFAYPMAKWSGSIWQPFFYTIAILGSLFLFAISFSNLLEVRKHIADGALVASMITGFCLVALTYGNAAYLFISLAGFSLSFIGAGMVHNSYHTRKGSRFNVRARQEIFLLEFFGSLIFMLITFTAISAAYPSAWLQAGSLQELLYSIGLTGGLGLFFISFMNLGGARGLPHGSMFVVVVTGLSLLIITFGNLTYFGLSLVGLALSVIGADILWRTR